MPLNDIVTAIEPADPASSQAARLRHQRLTKPPGSLGQLENLGVQLAGVFGTERPHIRGKTIIVAAADHGVVTEGVTGYPQAVTAQMVSNFLSGGAAISVMARRANVKLMIVDAGIATPLPHHPGLRVLSAGRGTANIAHGPAMTHKQAEQCIRAGVNLALEVAEAGADLIGTGDMGIGNTTSAAAITSAITGAPPRQTTGRGTGRSDAQLEQKIAVVERTLNANQPNPDDALDVLAKVGGFELGVLAGVMLGGALCRRIVVLDGFISGAAALIAQRLCPTITDYFVAAHRSAETGHAVVLSYLGLRPLLDLGLRLGEGTGAVLAMGLIEAAAASLADMATFDEAGVSGAIAPESRKPPQ